jgi:hypothetical protein
MPYALSGSNRRRRKRKEKEKKINRHLNNAKVTSEQKQVLRVCVVLSVAIRMSQRHDENGDLMIKSRKMLKQQLCGAISLKKVSDLIKSSSSEQSKIQCKTKRYACKKK